MTNYKWLLSLIPLGLTACQIGPSALPTRQAAVTVELVEPAVTTSSQPATIILETIPPTFTPQPAVAIPSPTPASLLSATAIPTDTPWPTATPTGTATNTATSTPSATATTDGTLTPGAPTPVTGEVNLLPNPSFEEGWYHENGLPELQVPNQWRLEWDEGGNSLDPDPWNRYVRPESRVLSRDFLPSSEHKLFIWDGSQTVKIFKREGSLSFRLLTDVFLEPGTYLFEINIFPDMIDGYTQSGSKIWAPDPLSGEFRFIVNLPAGEWIFPTFGQKGTYHHAFEVTATQKVHLGVAFRGRWAIENNGWFMDDWSLEQLSRPEAPS
jgi:hypothetical protein